MSLSGPASQAPLETQRWWAVTATPLFSAEDDVTYLVLFVDQDDPRSQPIVDVGSILKFPARQIETNQATASPEQGSSSVSPPHSSEPKLENPQQVETILSGIQDGFYILNSDWEFTFVNDRLCETVALLRTQILGRRIWDLFPEMVGTELHTQLYQAFSGQVPVHGEYFYPKTLRWHYQRVYPSPDGLTILGTDITDRKRVELIQMEQNHLLEMIAAGRSIDQCLASVCVLVSRLSGQARTCLLINDIGRSALHSIAPAFPESFVQLLKSILGQFGI